MAKCSICKKNEAVIFITKFENGKAQQEGICLSCAHRTGLGGMDKLLAKWGVNDDNVEQYTEMMNRMAGQFGDANPEEMLQNLFAQMPEDLQEQIQAQFENGFPDLSEMMEMEGNVDFSSFLEAMQGMDPQTMEAAVLSEDEGPFNPLVEEELTGDNAGLEKEKKEQFLSGKNDDSEQPQEKSEEKANAGSRQVGDFLKQLQGIFIADENTFQNLLPVARGGDANDSEHVEASVQGGKERKKTRKFLNQFGLNLTEKAKAGEIDRMIGRDKELERVVQILNRRNKNNPVLLGEPGVGKTAIAEGLAVRIAAGEVPPKLAEMEVYLLDMTGMVAGTQFRGQFESRMKGVVEEASAGGNIILVIDELHNIMGAGDADGAMNAANILKPALAKGKIRVLGSTTLNEYRRFVEKDSALERRFQQVLVEEPSAAETLEILKGVRDYYQEHHHVIYSDYVLETAVRYAGRYINERFFPDKAIDLIDEAGSQSNLKQKILVRIGQLKLEVEQHRAELAQLDLDLAKVSDQEPLDLYEKKAKLTSTLLACEAELQKLEAEAQPITITVEDIASVVEMWTGIPVRSITEAETEKLLELEDRLHERVIGQNEAIHSLARTIRRQRAGFGKKNKPASFIFVGPTGVGKTELVKALSEALFADETAMIRMDMSEFMEAHTVSKLIGSPPGYVGYDDGGQLTEKVRRHPYSVILFDEIEKAHADVFNLLLQILDDGRLTDSHGKVVSFENTIIIMTSNAGTSNRGAAIGFGRADHFALRSRVHQVLQELFRPEFLNRVDEIIVFESLQKDELRRIVDLMLKDLHQVLNDHRLQLVLAPEIKDYLVELGYSERYGARPLRKTIRRYLEEPLSELYLRGQLQGATEVVVHKRENADVPQSQFALSEDQFTFEIH